MFGTERRVPVEELTVGVTFVVRPGERIATDGEVLEGTSAVDSSLLTGESVPVDVGPGDAVVGATICDSGRLVVRATRVGSDTQLARIARLVEDAQTGKAEVQRLADRFLLRLGRMQVSAERLQPLDPEASPRSARAAAGPDEASQ